MKAPRKMRIEALHAEVASLDRIISKSESAGDLIGQFQLSRKRDAVLAEIRDLSSKSDSVGRVALFFGGGPVIGSKGVEADFAGEVMTAFQDLINKTLAKEEYGQPGSRGPVSGRASSQMIITDVARGSFGFVLEEAAAEDSIGETELKVVIDQVSHLVDDIASSNTERFEAAIGSLDSRTLISLRKFFGALDSNRATIRVVEDDEVFDLSRVAVTRARDRVERTEIDERESDSIVGVLFILPEHRKFELRMTDGSSTIYGGVDRGVVKQLFSEGLLGDGVVGRVWRTRMKIRTVRQAGREPKEIYTLKALLEEVLSGPAS